MMIWSQRKEKNMLNHDWPDHRQQIRHQPSETDWGRSCHSVWGLSHCCAIKVGSNTNNHRWVNNHAWSLQHNIHVVGNHIKLWWNKVEVSMMIWSQRKEKNMLNHDWPDHRQQIRHQPSETDWGRSCHSVWGLSHCCAIKVGSNTNNHRWVNNHAWSLQHNIHVVKYLFELCKAISITRINRHQIGILTDLPG